MKRSYTESELAAVERATGQALAGWVPLGPILVPLFKRRKSQPSTAHTSPEGAPAAAPATKPARRV